LTGRAPESPRSRGEQAPPLLAWAGHRPPVAVEPPWTPTYRAVASRFPPVSLFDQVADADELEVVFALQDLTNPRVRQEIGQISLVPPLERVAGPGSTPVMAAFTHLNRAGSRFSDGTWGVYYAAESVATAAAEVSFHSARFLQQTRQPAIEIDYRVYVARVQKRLHDVRSRRWDLVHDPDDYSASVGFARHCRSAGSWGLIYRSVRRLKGECVALFRPRALELPVIQGAHIALRWNGSAIDGWFYKSDHHPL